MSDAQVSDSLFLDILRQLVSFRSDPGSDEAARIDVLRRAAFAVHRVGTDWVKPGTPSVNDYAREVVATLEPQVGAF